MTPYAAQMDSPPDDPRLHDQDLRPGVDCWTVWQHATCIVDGQVQWAETDTVATEHTQGDAIWAAFHAAQRWDVDGVGLRPRGRGGTWQGSDGETYVSLHVRAEPVDPECPR